MIQRDRRSARRSARTGVGLLLALAVAACSESTTGPEGSGGLDTQGADANLASFDGFFESAEWRSFKAFGERVDGSGVHAAVLPDLEDQGDGARAHEVATVAARRLFAAASSIPLISQGSLGKTFVLDPGTGEYVEDPDRTDAPANGARFILYAPIDGTEDPDPDPDREVGYVDLVDNGAASPGIALRLIAVVEDVTFLDYGVALEGDETAGSVDVDGFLRHEGRQLDFSFGAEASELGGETTLAIDASLDVDSQDFHVVLDVDGTGPEGGESVTLALGVQFEANSIAIDATGDDDQIDATFRVNGNVFATATGDPDDPVILGAGGEQLTLDEIRVLIDIIEVSEDVMEFFGELLEPAGEIILLGVIL